MSAPAQHLRLLARDIGRLSPDWRCPERYFEERSEIEHKLKRLARELERAAHG